MIARRSVVVGFGAAIIWRCPVRAQQSPGHHAGHLPRIGLVSYERVKGQFLQGLRDLGYNVEKDVIIEYRPNDPAEMLAEYVTELIALDVDVIVAAGTQAVRAAQQATRRIPIVMSGSSDPVGNGLVASLARPGGNITGISLFNPELSGKRLELLKEIVGEVRRVAVLWNPNDPPAALSLRETESAGGALDIEVHAVAVRRADDFDATLASMIEVKPNAAVILSSPLVMLNIHRIALWALQNRLPAIFWERAFPVAGGLMSYGPDLDGLARRAAVFVDKILKGAKPADLPVEQPTMFELVINLKTAKALSLTVPQSIFARADEVIE
jgi:putative ABC transport system substrate-binding protein